MAAEYIASQRGTCRKKGGPIWEGTLSPMKEKGRPYLGGEPSLRRRRRRELGRLGDGQGALWLRRGGGSRLRLGHHVLDTPGDQLRHVRRQCEVAVHVDFRLS